MCVSVCTGVAELYSVCQFVKARLGGERPDKRMPVPLLLLRLRPALRLALPAHEPPSVLVHGSSKRRLCPLPPEEEPRVGGGTYGPGVQQGVAAPELRALPAGTPHGAERRLCDENDVLSGRARRRRGRDPVFSEAACLPKTQPTSTSHPGPCLVKISMTSPHTHPPPGRRSLKQCDNPDLSDMRDGPPWSLERGTRGLCAALRHADSFLVTLPLPATLPSLHPPRPMGTVTAQAWCPLDLSPPPSPGKRSFPGARGLGFSQHSPDVRTYACQQPGQPPPSLSTGSVLQDPPNR